MLSGSKAKLIRSTEMSENMSSVNTSKVLLSWSSPGLGSNIIDQPVEDDSNEEFRPVKLSKGDSFKRKIAIQYIFKNKLNAPERSEWKNKAVISKIMEALGMPKGSRQSVTKALEDYLANEDSSRRLSRRGRKRNFVDYSDEANFLCNLFESTDSSDSTVAAIVNLNRVARGGVESKTTSRSAVRNFRLNSTVLNTSA